LTDLKKKGEKVLLAFLIIAPPGTAADKGHRRIATPITLIDGRWFF
jgi:hypothetical protein